jgi:hypothetical protein
MSRRRQQRTWPPYVVAFVCTGFGSHPRRVLALVGASRHPDGSVTIVSRRGTGITRPLPAPGTWTFDPRQAINCRTCPAHRDYTDGRLYELVAEALGDGTQRTVDVDICYRP